MQTLRLYKTWYLLGWMIMFLLAGQARLLAATSSPSVNPSMKLSVNNHRLSAHINQVPLQTVLETLSSKFPIRFTLKGIDQDSLLSTSFHNLSFDQGLQRLLLGYDYAIIRSSNDTYSNDVSLPSMEVVILSRNPEAALTVSHIESLGQKLKDYVQPAVIPIHQEPQIENYAASSVATHENEDLEFLPLLEEALGESIPETPQLVQDLLTRLKAGEN